MIRRPPSPTLFPSRPLSGSAPAARTPPRRGPARRAARGLRPPAPAPAARTGDPSRPASTLPLSPFPGRSPDDHDPLHEGVGGAVVEIRPGTIEPVAERATRGERRRARLGALESDRVLRDIVVRPDDRRAGGGAH